MLLQLSHFPPPFFPSALHPSSHLHSPPPLSSCPWVAHRSSLASPFPILFLTSPCLFCTYNLCFFLFKRIYLFIFRERGREGEREGEQETSTCGCLSLGPHWEPGPQPRHVPWLGIEPTTTLFRRPALNPVSYTSQGYLYFLFPVPLPPFSTLHLPSDNPPHYLHFCDCGPVLVVCLVCFYF